ncbi:GntR family transcriptional regulator [Paenibacillus timonensis]|uniref:GntR family transcriptional regulator n=1 Tax=Paenibacillus timonensis TaxID=225915 RepID=A0ABW3SB33_9BACL|nr:MULTISPECIES: GntR family transcriptional regulator [Paenibacillus]MCH1639751.1 GntR family transcriptional regulator [Paenibacillus timonensis]MDU2240438.1 GntR family transcriptional regulator [Paenibacillus sp.]GJM82172.1 GntR family transcriptional regulator [Paenibacillus sp. HMSSN-139]
MIIQLDLQSDVPIYTQLVHQIIEGIASGRLQPGEPLPSVRSLASDIGVNLHTVNKAYTLLKQEGYIQVHRQKGVVIDPVGMPPVTPEFREKQRRELRPIVAEAICRGMEKDELLSLVEQIHQEITRKE